MSEALANDVANLIEQCLKKDKEIDTHIKLNKQLLEDIDRAGKENERLNNIIKEVREYIKENQEEHKYTDRGGFTYTEGHFLRDSDTLLEILDKEGNVDE